MLSMRQQRVVRSEANLSAKARSDLGGQLPRGKVGSASSCFSGS